MLSWEEGKPNQLKTKPQTHPYTPPGYLIEVQQVLLPQVGQRGQNSCEVCWLHGA
jgi:hypothetical protein